jgi:uncharacterized protein (TIGR02145 family)
VKTIINSLKRTCWLKVSLAFITCLLFLIFPSCQRDEFDQDPILGIDELSTSSLMMLDKDKDKKKYNLIKDVDGNKYLIVDVGNPNNEWWWMAENLKTTRFNDGTKIPLVEGMEWATLESPAYCWYLNDMKTFGDTYGAMYNWYVISQTANGGKNVCPTGWHVPSPVEWDRLITKAGGPFHAGGTLKATGSVEHGDGLWHYPNIGATNSLGFTALPGGKRANGFYGDDGWFGLWWVRDDGSPFCYTMDYDSPTAFWDLWEKSAGVSIRCVKGD